MDIRLTNGGQRPGKGWIPVTRGAHRRSDTQDPFRAELRAWLAVLPPEAVLTHVTAARLWGLWLPPLPADAAHVAQLPPTSHPVRRAGVRVLRTPPLAPPQRVAGLPVASPADVLLSLCRDFGDLDALMTVDAALHMRLTTVEELHHATIGGRHGAPRLRRLIPLAEALTESAWETVLREFHRVLEAPVTPQFTVYDGAGRFVARGDLRLDGTNVLHEYDGGVHREVTQHHHDLRRDRLLQHAGWIRRGYTSTDLLRRPEEVRADIDHSLGRASVESRLTSWRALLAGSTLTRTGRAQVWPRLVR